MNRDDVVEKFIELLAANDRIANDCKASLPLVHDPEIVKAFDFLARLDALAKKYQFIPKDIISLLDPSYAIVHPESDSDKTVQSVLRKRKPRAMKRYRNPHTGETLQTKGANHKLLKEWKATYGAAVVEGWLDR